MNNMNQHNRVLSSLKLFAGLALVWLTAILSLSIFEYFTHKSGLQTHNIFWYKLLVDAAFWSKAYFVLSIGFVLLCWISSRLAVGVAIALIMLLVIGQAALMKYFSAALVPLGADLYGYSFRDITQTAGASGSLHVMDIVIMIAFLALLFFLLRWFAKTPRTPIWLAAGIGALSLAVFITDADTVLAHRRFGSEFDANVSLNKLDFFLKQSYTHFFPPDQSVDIYSDDYVVGGDAKDTIAGRFIYPDESSYPFYHIDSTRDVLSPFFRRSSPQQPPNIVIILVEGLGRAFTNKDAYLGNFTPFLDSLAGKSLYWKNFLSEGGRTFAVLPSLLASLPFAKNGFLELGAGMPDHFSLPGLLKTAGYHSSFYYGGDAHFDNMDLLLKKDGIDELNDGKSFPPGYTRLPAQNGFSWGYNDKELFRRWLDTRPPVPVAAGPPAASPTRTDGHPQCSIILTVSTHSPFLLNEPAVYADRMEKRFDQLGFDENAKTAHREFQAQYMSILYADDALRGFFSVYAKRSDYNNTIFLITGDHRMPEIPMRSKIDRYHVPLIVFSPMLSRSAEFLSVSTHYDIVPSLLAFLHTSYGLAKPSAAQWMGSGLDTAAAFRNIHAYPLMQTKTDLLDFVKGEYHLNGSQLFKLSADMNEDPVSEDRQQALLTAAFNAFLRKNERLSSGTRLLPDSAIHNEVHK